MNAPASQPFDFAVIGSTPLAALLAVQLATRHKQRVCLVAQTASPYRLPRSVDMSLGALTRPATWAMLARSTAEVLKLTTRLAGRSAVVRFDPVLMAETALGADVLGHVHQLALAYGFAAERLHQKGATRGNGALLLRDVAQIMRSKFDAGADFARHGVRRIDASTAEFTVATDGSFLGQDGDAEIVATHSVLADDDAILAHLPQWSLPTVLATVTGLSVVTEPTTRLAGRTIEFIDRGVTLMQRRNGVVTALASGPQGAGQISGALDASDPVRIVAQSRYLALRSVDGAPVFGRSGDGPTIVAGFGPTGAFLTPVLARSLAQAAGAGDQAFCNAVALTRALAPSQIAEYHAAPLVAETALP